MEWKNYLMVGLMLAGYVAYFRWKQTRVFSPPAPAPAKLPQEVVNKWVLAVHSETDRPALLAINSGNYGPVLQLLKNCRSGRWEERFSLVKTCYDTMDHERLADMVDAEPDNADLHLLLGVTTLAWAWKGQSTPEFWVRQDKAERSLLRALELDAEDPCPSVFQMRIAGARRKPLQGHLDEASRRVPNFMPALDWFVGHQFAQQWGGDEAEGMRFAGLRSQHAAPGSPEHTLLMSVIQDHWHYRWHWGKAGEAEAYLAEPHLRQRVAEAYDLSLGHPGYVESPNTVRQANQAAFLLFLMQDRERCAQALRGVGNRLMEYPWRQLGPADEAIGAARAWALEGKAFRLPKR